MDAIRFGRYVDGPVIRTNQGSPRVVTKMGFSLPEPGEDGPAYLLQPWRDTERGRYGVDLDRLPTGDDAKSWFVDSLIFIALESPNGPQLVAEPSFSKEQWADPADRASRDRLIEDAWQAIMAVHEKGVSELAKGGFDAWA